MLQASIKLIDEKKYATAHKFMGHSYKFLFLCYFFDLAHELFIER